MAVLRAEIPVAYKTTILRTIALALREVFTSEYPDSDFRDLNITTEYPLTEIEYPAIVISYQESTINQAGVGHREYFPDPVGAFREWNHRRFEGTLEFSVHALSPLDRDVLSDALIEVLSFGKLDPLQNNFFIRVYGAENVDVGVLGLLHQISLNTDIIEGMGESNAIAPWNPEDALVYTNGYSMACHGGFYNTVRSTPGLGFVEQSIIIPSFDVHALEDEDPSNQWSMIFDYHDDGAVVGKGVISAAQIGNDAATVIGQGVISAETSFVAGVTDDFIIQTASRQDNASYATTTNATWAAATQSGSHLFMVVALRHIFAFSSFVVTPPAGWTVVGSAGGVNNGTGPLLYVFQRLNSTVRSGTETCTIASSNGTAALELSLNPNSGMRSSVQLIEVNQDTLSGAATGIATFDASTDQYTVGYVAGNPSGGGILFDQSGTHAADSFVLAFFTNPFEGAPVWHIDTADALARSDGWRTILDTAPLHLDTNSPGIHSYGQPAADDSVASGTHTQDLRAYNGDAAYNAGQQQQAGLWLRVTATP